MLNQSEDLTEIADKIGSVLIFESGPPGGHRRELPKEFDGKPIVTVTPFKQQAVESALTTIPVALPGVETDGVFMRADGLPLNAVRIPELQDKGYPTATQFLERVRGEVAG